MRLRKIYYYNVVSSPGPFDKQPSVDLGYYIYPGVLQRPVRGDVPSGQADDKGIQLDIIHTFNGVLQHFSQLPA